MKDWVAAVPVLVGLFMWARWRRRLRVGRRIMIGDQKRTVVHIDRSRSLITVDRPAGPEDDVVFHVSRERL